MNHSIKSILVVCSAIIVLSLAWALVATTLAWSGCITNDSWRGPDKNKHFAVGVAMGSSWMLVFKDAHRAFIAAAVVGALKEAYDAQGHGTCSLQDFAVTALGAAAGAYGTAWVITPRFIGYSKTF